MSQHKTRPIDWLVLSLVFGGVVGYCVSGAITGSLFIPAKRGPSPGIYLSGTPAWTLVAAFSLLWLGVAIRMGLFKLPARARSILEFALLFVGIGLMVFSYYCHAQNVL